MWLIVFYIWQAFSYLLSEIWSVYLFLKSSLYSSLNGFSDSMKAMHFERWIRVWMQCFLNLTNKNKPSKSSFIIYFNLTFLLQSNDIFNIIFTKPRTIIYVTDENMCMPNFLYLLNVISMVLSYFLNTKIV